MPRWWAKPHFPHWKSIETSKNAARCQIWVSFADSSLNTKFKECKNKAKHFTVKRLFENDKFDLFGISKCQLVTLGCVATTAVHSIHCVQFIVFCCYHLWTRAWIIIMTLILMLRLWWTSLHFLKFNIQSQSLLIWCWKLMHKFVIAIETMETTEFIKHTLAARKLNSWIYTVSEIWKHAKMLLEVICLA